MEYKIILILIACYLLITYALYNCVKVQQKKEEPQIPDVVEVHDDDDEYYKLNPNELIRNQKYVFPPLKQEEIDNPYYNNFVDVSNKNPKSLDDYKKLQFELK